MHQSNSFSLDPPRWGIELTPDVPVTSVQSLGRRAEAAGFDVVFVSNHYLNRDPFLALGSLASTTERIQLGPGVMNPYESHPVRLASQVATLDELSGGRAVFGIGAGDRSTLADLGVDRDRPIRTVLEAMQVARQLWSGERVEHAGTFVADGTALRFQTGPIPTYVGGQGPDMLRMAGKYADGVLINAAHPTDYAWAAEQIEAGRRDRSRDLADPTVAAFASTSIAEDADSARTAARPAVAFIVAGAPEPVLQRHGIDMDAAGAVRDALSGGDLERAYTLVTVPMLDAFCVAGTRSAVVKRISALFEHVDAFVAASPLGPNRAAAIDRLGEIAATVDGEGSEP